MAEDSREYVARLVVLGAIRQTIVFESTDSETAWRDGNDGVDPLSGQWVEVKPVKPPQLALKLE